MKTTRMFFAATLTTGLAVAGVAFAGADDVRAAREAKLSLIQAIQTAEKHQGGKAIEAGLDDDSFTPTYEVSVLSGEKVFDVRVDAVNGSVLGAREDIDD